MPVGVRHQLEKDVPEFLPLHAEISFPLGNGFETPLDFQGLLQKARKFVSPSKNYQVATSRNIYYNMP